MSIIEHHLPYGDSPPLHLHHDEDEVFHVLEGTLRLRVGDREQVARSGQTLVAPRGLPHSYRVESPDGARCLTITTGAGFESLVRSFGRPADHPGLPVPMIPTPDMVQSLGREAARHGIDLVGPPIA